jgi:hypothetical protein
MKLKHAIGVVVLSTSLVLACSSAPPAGTSVESPDSWAGRDAAAAGFDLTAVAGYESTPASVSAVQVEPAASPEWEVTEGHVTIVGYADTQ